MYHCIMLALTLTTCSTYLRTSGVVGNVYPWDVEGFGLGKDEVPCLGLYIWCIDSVAFTADLWEEKLCYHSNQITTLKYKI